MISSAYQRPSLLRDESPERKKERNQLFEAELIFSYLIYLNYKNLVFFPRNGAHEVGAVELKFLGTEDAKFEISG